MQHYVFCAAINHPTNQKSIKIAKIIVEHLENIWSLEEDIAECHYHSSIIIIENCDNIEIKFDNNDITQLINDCMTFARLQQNFKLLSDNHLFGQSHLLAQRPFINIED